MAESCTQTQSVPTPPALERSHASLTLRWMLDVEWSRTRCPRLCTLLNIMVIAALQDQADSTPAWLFTHPATSTIRYVWEIKSWLFVHKNPQIFSCDADVLLCQVTQVPYVVTLNQNLYVQVDLRRGDNTLVLFIDTCVASPSPHDFHTRPYYLVRNG